MIICGALQRSLLDSMYVLSRDLIFRKWLPSCVIVTVLRKGISLILRLEQFVDLLATGTTSTIALFSDRIVFCALHRKLRVNGNSKGTGF